MLLDFASTVAMGTTPMPRVRIVYGAAGQPEHAAIAVDRDFRAQVGGLQRRREV